MIIENVPRHSDNYRFKIFIPTQCHNTGLIDCQSLVPLCYPWYPARGAFSARSFPKIARSSMALSTASSVSLAITTLSSPLVHVSLKWDSFLFLLSMITVGMSRSTARMCPCSLSVTKTRPRCRNRRPFWAYM